MAEMYDVAIIGAGVTGFGAAMYSGRFHLKTIVIGEKVGGTIILTDDVANYPGFKRLTGMELAQKIQEHAEEYGITLKDQKVTKLEKADDGSFNMFIDEERIQAKAVILATGTIWRKLDVPGEEEYASKGVHYCALCDGAFYKDKVVAIVGGSDSAGKEALVLTQWAKKVYILYRGEKIRPEPVTMARIEQNSKIEIINHVNVKEIKGTQFVNKVLLDRMHHGSTEFPLDGVFIDVGHIALSDLARQVGAKLNKKGEVMIDREAKTNIEGFYAAGDVVDTTFKQAITGVAEGVTAAYSAFNYIKSLEIKPA
ncbi:MAG: FAD-dependent oxidoreductase [Nanoarchaeota archaeon]